MCIGRAVHALEFILGAFPKVLDGVGVHAGARIDKVERVVDCGMGKTSDSRELSVCCPLVTPDSAPGKNILLDNGQQRGGVPTVDLDEKSLVRGFVDASKDPSLAEWASTSICCCLRGRYHTLVSLVYLHDVPRTSNLLWMGLHPICAEIPVHIKPVGQRSLGVDVEPGTDRCLAHVIERPEVSYLQ